MLDLNSIHVRLIFATPFNLTCWDVLVDSIYVVLFYDLIYKE
jgi:hypothetical protein